MPHNNPGYDIRLAAADGDDPIRIEVKGRIAGAEDFCVTHNEVLTAHERRTAYRLALVRVDPDGPSTTRSATSSNPFARLRLRRLRRHRRDRGNWETTWARGRSRSES